MPYRPVYSALSIHINMRRSAIYTSSKVTYTVMCICVGVPHLTAPQWLICSYLIRACMPYHMAIKCIAGTRLKRNRCLLSPHICGEFCVAYTTTRLSGRWMRSGILRFCVDLGARLRGFEPSNCVQYFTRVKTPQEVVRGCTVAL